MHVFATRAVADGCRALRCRDCHLREVRAVREAQPAVVGPCDFLDRCFAAERVQHRVRERAGHEMREIPFAVLCLDERAMAGFLHRGRRIVHFEMAGVGVAERKEVARRRCDNRLARRIGFVRAENVLRTSTFDAVAVACAASCCEQIIEIAVMIELRRFDAAARREVRRDAVPASDDAAMHEIGFGDREVARRLVAGARLPFEAGDVMMAVLVIERRIEADGCDVDRLRPRPRDAFGAHRIRLGIELAAGHVLHVRVDEPEAFRFLIIGKMWRPDAGRRVRALEIDFAAFQEIRQQLPVDEIRGVEDLNGRLPMKG